MEKCAQIVYILNGIIDKSRFVVLREIDRKSTNLMEYSEKVKNFEKEVCRIFSNQKEFLHNRQIEKKMK